jgi:uncharacterized HAD superfamily protein
MRHGMIYCFDIDGTICTSVQDSAYEKAEVYLETLQEINSLYEEGHKIIFMTARGSVSGKDWTELTEHQLKKWGFKYHELIMHKKPNADFYIDDKGVNALEWRSSLANKTQR